MATVERLSVYPVKGLDGIDVDRTDILEGGTFRYDREFALFDTDGEVLNGKRTEAVHDLTTGFDPKAGLFEVETEAGERRQFDLGDASEPAEEWFSDYFSVELELRRDASLGFVDRREMGPSVISTATLETVASWFDEISVDSMRRRLRANIELGGVPAFWEDHLFADRDHRIRFSIGDTSFVGVNPCQRCVVPTRDPDTGEEYPEFQSIFVENRRKTMPAWSGGDWFDHDFRLMVNTVVPQSSWGETIAVGDRVVVGDRVAVDE